MGEDTGTGTLAEGRRATRTTTIEWGTAIRWYEEYSNRITWVLQEEGTRGMAITQNCEEGGTNNK